MNTSIRSHFASMGGYYLIAGGISCFFIAVATVAYLSFNVPFVDDQALFAQMHYNILFHLSTDTTVGVQVDHFSFHFSPIMVAFAPLYGLSQNWIAVASFAVGSIAATGILIGKLAEEQLESRRIGYLFSAVFFLSPSTMYLGTMGYRMSIMAMGFLTGALYAYQNDRFRVFAVMLVLAAICKETIVLTLVPLSVLAILHRRSWKWILTPAIFGLSYFFIVTTYVMPAFRGGSGFAGTQFDRFSFLGDSVPEIVLSLLTEPLLTIGYITNPSDLVFYAKILFPTGFLALLAPEILLVAASQILIVALPESQFFSNIGWWYQAPLIPFVWVAAIYGLRRADKIIHRVITRYTRLKKLVIPAQLSLPPGATVVRFVVPLLLLSMLVVGIAADGYQLGRAEQQLSEAESSDYAMWESVNEIPDGASVSAGLRFTPHLSDREDLYVFPHVPDVDFIVVSPQNSPYRQRYDGEYGEQLAELNQTSTYQINEKLSANSVLVYKRQEPNNTG